MSKPNVDIREPDKTTRFSTLCGPNGLYRHVADHVFKRDEKFSQLFDADLIAEAKQNSNYGSQKIAAESAFHRLSLAYQTLISDTLYSLCSTNNGHLHFCKVRNEDEAFQAIEAWDIKTKMQIIAKSFVRKGKFLPYVLCSAYRPCPKLSGKQIRKKVLERWSNEAQSVFNGTVLAVHDNENN